MKKLLILFLFTFTVHAREKIDTTTEYIHMYDTSGYVNHQVNETMKYNNYELFYQHNQTESQTQFYYDKALISKTYTFQPSFTSPIKAKFGVGTIYGLGWDAIPTYAVDVLYNRIDLNVSRNAVAAVQNNQFGPNGYSHNYTDDIVLTYDHPVTDKYTIVVGGLYSLYNDGNIRQGVILKNIYQVNDIISLQTNSRLTYTDFRTVNYFSPDINEYHRFLAVGAYPITEDLVLKASAGPALVNIMQRREVVPFYDVKVVYNNTVAGKWNLGYSCNETTYGYRFCQAGASVNLKF